MRKPNPGREPKDKKLHILNQAHMNRLLVIFLIVLTGFGILLSKSYKELNLSIQDERIRSVEQIGLLLSDQVSRLKDVYMKDTQQLANMLEGFQIHTKEELKEALVDEGQFLLVTESGMLKTLDGENWMIDDNSLRENILYGTEVNTSFASEQTRGDYWLFSIRTDPVVIEEDTIIGVVKAVGAKEYAKVATMSLFDGMGAAYVTDNSGVIIMRPDLSDMPDEFNGYNMFQILKQAHVPAAKIKVLKDSIQEQKNYQMIANIGKTIWLIQSVPGDYGRGIVITVPISITAKDTYTGMRRVIILIALVVLVLAAIAILCMLYILRRNQIAEVTEVRMKAKNDFLDKMSHDIRTPLNAIVGMHELALRSLDDKKALADYLDKAKKSSEYLISVINDILDMSKIENGKMKISHVPFSMEELLDHVYQMEILSAQSKRITFQKELLTAVATDYIGDPVRIRQCLMNLVSNAVKFTPEGGVIRLCYREEKQTQEKNLVIISVQDTGIGMSEAFLSQLFNPFEQETSSMTSSYPGSGLGLSIVKNLVDLMGGTIDVQSRWKEGSTFTITLPLVKAAKEEKSYTDKSETALLKHLKGKRILFVEDNELNREIGVSLLEQFGLVVEQAENGKEAVEKFSGSADGYYSLIVMDIQMPVMNGYDAARAIRSLGHRYSQSIPILALSANAFDEDARKSLDAGMQGHLAKPIDLAELVAALRKYIK